MVGCSLFLVFSSVALSSAHHALAAKYTVGDEAGWDSGINYFDWSQKYNFTVGDILVFSYVKKQHNLYVVTESTYRSCNTSAGVLSTYDTGDDLFNLTQPVKYWFLCNVEGHCKGGMRFGITVEAANGSNNPVDFSPPPVAPLQPQGSEAAPGRQHTGRWMAELVAVILLQLMNLWYQ